MNNPVSVAETASASTPNHLWRNGNFVRLWTGNAVSNILYQMYTLALPMIIIDSTHSTMATGIMRAVEFLPNLLLASVLGVLVDRFSRKRTMLAAVATQVAVMAILLTLLISGNTYPWALYLLAFVVSSAGYAFGNAYHSCLPTIVDREQLTSANASLTFVNSLFSITGPGMAGFVLAVAGYSVGVGGTLIGLLVLGAMVASIRIPYQPAPRKRVKGAFWHELKEGWQQLRGTQVLWTMTVMILLMNIASAVSGAVLVFYARDVLHATASQIGAMYSCSAVGMMVASLIAKRSRQWSGRGKVILVAGLVDALGQFILFLSGAWYIMAIGMMLIGFASALINVHYFTVRQESTPNHMLGRVAGTSSMVMKLAMPISFFISGLVGAFIQVNVLFLASSLLLILIMWYAVKNGIHRFV